MNVFWVFSAKRIKSFSIIILTALMAALFLYVERTQLPVFSTSEGPQAFYRAEIEQKQVALTFNISWGDQRVGPILEVLKENNMKEATFFVSASWAERYPDIVKQIVDDGHIIGSHGYQYKDYTKWEDDKVNQDMQTSKRVLSDLAGQSPQLLRPPNGDFDKRILQIADKQGLSIIHWSVDSKDYTNPGVEKIVENTLSETTAGDILLFHASDSAKQTHEALPIVLKELKGKGFSFISVEQMMENAKSSSEEIQ
ncbi:polysaccharide deacetylase family sporulation protein PdaB [Alkalihalobacillus pseudalcaliphilus]|uniref:polysaccharide deacetylase family sporulation protein PdaB n=1 Tax=Alkalihalobacillus pseudalcaliphilus TaxID=79884 RepID=UPI00064D8781|nr:polysaccharide deacetylase family sporulation protein PdaB [Alkalihalobacillus pseudalcaliphilus]KMK74911.1 polysaccharide deacetylase [Alkalihalobacillus pseudalcaliphilus]